MSEILSELVSSDDRSPLLGLPLLRADQARKHITHNEALRQLDLLVQARVISRSLSSPPEEPEEGDRYLLPSGGSGDWAGRGGQIAFFSQNGWDYLTPAPGWTLWVEAESQALRYSGGAWRRAADLPLEVARLGIAATASGADRLALSGEASLFTHEGGGHQIKVNKASAEETASLLFQTAWGGRAELGTTGSDDFALKVSADGSSWTTAFAVARDSGLLRGAALTQDPEDATPGRIMRSGDYGWPRALPLSAEEDLDSLAGGGARICASAALTAGNHYPEASAGALLELSRPGAGGAQLYLCESSGALWSRAQNSAGVWQPWARQSSQRGSTAAGQWLRLPDGTQICHHSLTASASAATTWTYPMAFSAAPVVTGCAVATVLSALCLEAAPGSSSASFSLRNSSNARRADVVHLTATGRWA